MIELWVMERIEQTLTTALSDEMQKLDSALASNATDRANQTLQRINCLAVCSRRLRGESASTIAISCGYEPPLVSNVCVETAASQWLFDKYAVAQNANL